VPTSTLLNRTDPIPIEAECLTPVRIKTLAALQIVRLEVFHGNRTATLANFFSIDTGRQGDELRNVGDCPTVKWIGRGMTGGRIVVEGAAGMQLGAESLAGGTIDVNQLCQWGFRLPGEDFSSGVYSRYNGEPLDLGKGEILARR
jgi:formylmethanofuran dehydrogenase subunit C